MRLVPESNVGKIEFFTSRLDKWLANAAALGIDAAELAALEAEIHEARAAQLAQRMAQSAARSATLRRNLAIEKMSRRGAAIVQQIRAEASVAGAGVYSLAQIPPPADASPIGPPGKPQSLKAELLSIGWLKLRWTSKNPRGSVGTIYRISRRTEPNGPFEFIGISGERKFIDRKVPAGSARVEYEVQGIRSTAVGEVARFQYNFGTTRNSVPTAVMVPTSPPRVATIAA